jgi:hypothetical protein
MEKQRGSRARWMERFARAGKILGGGIGHDAFADGSSGGR